MKDHEGLLYYLIFAPVLRKSDITPIWDEDISVRFRKAEKLFEDDTRSEWKDQNPSTGLSASKGSFWNLQPNTGDRVYTANCNVNKYHNSDWVFHVSNKNGFGYGFHKTKNEKSSHYLSTPSLDWASTVC